jgi:integrase
MLTQIAAAPAMASPRRSLFDFWSGEEAADHDADECQLCGFDDADCVCGPPPAAGWYDIEPEPPLTQAQIDALIAAMPARDELRDYLDAQGRKSPAELQREFDAIDEPEREWKERMPRDAAHTLASEKERPAPPARELVGRPRDGAAPRISNYKLIHPENGVGPSIKAPLTTQEIVEGIQAATGGWPKSCDGSLFVPSRAGVRWLRTGNDLHAWTSEVAGESGRVIEWGRGSDLLTMNAAHSSMLELCDRFESVEVFPHHPPHAASYYLLPAQMPEPGSGAFDDLLAMFEPDTEADRDLIRAFFLTLVWGGPGGKRPIFGFEAATENGKAGQVIRETIQPAPASPDQITPDLANRFGRLFLGGTYSRGKASDAKQYRRSPTTLASHIRNLSALWTHFRDLALVRDNPWKDVRPPKTDKKRKPVPEEADIESFFAWVRKRYPKWERLHAILELKAMSGCRTLDIVQLRSEQLRAGRVVWTPNQTKQREGRAVLVPDELFGRLVRIAGPVYLWEGFLEDLKEYRPSKNRPPEKFDPMTVYWVLGNIFREYSDAHPGRRRLTPHALRRRAITLVTVTTQSVDATAAAIGINPATARAYYLDAQRAFNTDEVFKNTAGALIPKTAHTKPTLFGNKPAKTGTPRNKAK